METSWENEFIRISQILDRKFYNLKTNIDVGSEAYVFLLKRYRLKGLELPDKPKNDNLKMYSFLARKWVLTLARSLRTQQRNETCTEFDESLAQSANLMKEDTYDFGENDVQDKLDLLAKSKHKDNQQLSIFAKCMNTLNASGANRQQVLDSITEIMGLKRSRIYELERTLKEFLSN